MPPTAPPPLDPLIDELLAGLTAGDHGPCLPEGRIAGWAEAVRLHTQRQILGRQLLVIADRLKRGNAQLAGSQFVALAALALGDEASARAMLEGELADPDSRRLVGADQRVERAVDAALDAPSPAPGGVNLRRRS